MPTKKKAKRKSVTKAQIVNYWASRVDESDLGVDWCDALDRCWRCAIETKRLERCHIIPKSLGGADDKSNLILLCKRCHREGPNVKDKNFMWEWIKKTREVFYDTMWGKKYFDSFENFYGINAFSLLEDAEDFPDILEKIRDSMGVLFTEVTQHWGEDINDMTRAWIVNEILKEMKLI